MSKIFYLPLDYKRVTQGFDCKNSCDGRTYIYILPTFAFTPIEEVNNFKGFAFLPQSWADLKWVLLKTFS